MASVSRIPDDAIQRVLYIHPRVHIYQIPPLTSTKGHTAAQWTNNPPLFTARLRIIETTLSSTTPSPSITPNKASRPNGNTVNGRVPPSPSPPRAPSGSTNLSTFLELTDPNTGELFAAAPYNSAAAVEQALDSSRFFAIRVVGDGGRKAVLGMGFEERGDAFDFGVSLQECRKVLGFSLPGELREAAKAKNAGAERKDFALKEGEMITVNIGGLGRRKRGGEEKFTQGASASSDGQVPVLIPPPPSAVELKRRSRELNGVAEGAQDEFQGQTAEELGFDDGEFGEFQ